MNLHRTIKIYILIFLKEEEEEKKAKSFQHHKRQFYGIITFLVRLLL